MSTRTPPLQTRSQFNRSWGNFATAADLPNASGAPLAAPFFSILEVGDTAYSVADGATYTCTSVGTAGGGDAVWSSGGGGGGGSGLLWSWNGIDTSQFDPTPVATAGQSGSLSVLPADVSLQRPVALLRMQVTWAGSGGALAFRVAPSEGLVLPSRYRVRFGIQGEDTNMYGGFWIYDASTWGANLHGTGLTFERNYIRSMLARGAGAGSIAPFIMAGGTPGWALRNEPEQGGSEVHANVAWGSAPGVPPAILLRLLGQGATGGGSTTAPVATVDRGRAIADSFTTGGSPNASFDGVALDSFGLCAMSGTLGTFNLYVDRIEIYAD